MLGLDVSQLNHLPPDLATKLHGLAKGAFTADQDEVIIGTVDLLEMPVVSTTVLVKVTWVMSPSAFYITFPHGTRDISSLQQLDINKRHPTMFSNMKDSMQLFYQGNCR